MSFNKTIKGIFGYFWTELWKDSWLVQALQTIYAKYLYPINNIRLHNVYMQTSVRYNQLDTYTFPKRIMLDKQSKRHAVKNLQQLYIGESSQSADPIGQSDSSLFAYSIKQMFQTPTRITNSILNPSYSSTDFYIQQQQFITPVDFAQENIKQTTFIHQKQPALCYQLWGQTQYIDPTIDAYSAIAKVPKDWAIKYPGAIQDAWHIRQFGATEFRVKSLIGRVCQCPVAQQNGVVTDIIQSTVYINKKPYACWDKDSILVNKGQRITKGQALCSFSPHNRNAVVRVYSGQTPPVTQLSQIPVTTSVGIMYAQNAYYSDSQSTLPLTSDNITLLKYKSVCQNKKAAGLPYVQLPTPINPMRYLIEQVWGKRCIIFLIPSRNIKDMQIAFSCIIDNLPVGTICVVYKQSILTQPVQLNLTEKSQVLAYYQSSVNNNMTKEISYGAN